MRRRFAAPLLAVALLLAGCGGGDGDEAEESASPEASASASAAPQKTDPDAKLPEITAGSKFGEEPTITSKGDPPPDVRFEVLSEGDGPPVKAGELLAADYRLQAWGSTEALDGSFGDAPLLKPVGKNGISPGWDAKIPGVKAGSRVMLIEPGAAGTQLAGKTLMFVIDILGSVDPKAAADGESVTPKKGLPEVTGKTDPAIAIPKGEDPPKDLVAQLLLRGKGEEVKDGKLAVVQYTGIIWADGKQFDSSWDRDGGPSPFSSPVGQPGIIAAWNEGLVGKPVGSRVLLVVPPDKGYGAEGNAGAGIKGTDTLIFVIDILGSF